MKRTEMLSALADTETLWDMLIVGGGATGLGTALDAASRGHSCLLVEAADFTQGTSSRSTKLIHGGVRYLQNMQVSMVRESLRERGNLLRNAPGLVKALNFCIPCYSRFEQAYYYAGLKAYDLLAGKQPVDGSRWLNRQQTLENLETLKPSRLCGGVQYSDAQFDDARLGMALARTAAVHGGRLLNHMSLQHIEHSPGSKLATVLDALTGREYKVRAKVVVNATGVFAEKVLALAGERGGADANLEILPSRGSHIVIDRSFLPGKTALLLPKTDDGRVLFAIPWQGSTLIGTTDVATHDIVLNPSPTMDEVEYLLEHAGKILAKQPTRADVTSAFAGLRPLVKPKSGAGKTAQASREHVIVAERGIVSIIGGKWTTYRKMAEDVVNIAEQMGGLKPVPSRTQHLELLGGEFLSSSVPEGPAHEGPAHGDQQPEATWSTADNFDSAFVQHAVKHEMACSVEDVLARRRRLLFVDSAAAIRIAPQVAQAMAAALGHDEQWQDAQVKSFLQAAKNFSLPTESSQAR